jgi:RNA polymerase sigma-70 factor (ECF subfamily)
MTEELIRLAQHGDRAAFETLAEGVLDHLYAAATLLLHDPILAQDAVQEALVRAWRSLPRLRDPERFAPWLRRLLVHTCIDAARSERRHRGEHELPLMLADPANIELEMADRDEVACAFAALSPQHRAALVLRHYYGHSVAEVADALHVPVGTAKSRIHYAERALVHALDADSRWAGAGGIA